MARARSSSPGHPTDRLLGRSSVMSILRTRIRELAAFDTLGNPYVPTVLLRGETGAGKGLVARIIHDSGPRASGPFIEVNCAAIPETLLEAELFGFEAGTFTDARHAKPGLFQVASGGTLFLDEIAELPLAVQSKLLTAIEGKRVRRLGAVAEQPVDVKLIVATQAELSGLVRVGRFRADLYHRLAVLLLEVPPLRALGDDILVLAQHFLGRYAEAHGLCPKRLNGAAEAWLRCYDWPGNVRELSHLMERATLSSPEALLSPATLEQLCLPRLQDQVAPDVRPPSKELAPMDEPTQIRQALRQTGGNVVRAAALLGFTRSAMRHRMQRYGITSARAEAWLVPSPTHDQSIPPRLMEVNAAPRRAAARAPVARWEQRPVAVLAIDLTLPTPDTIEVQGSEPWTEASRWQQMIREKVQGFGGGLISRTPPLLMAVFGLLQGLEQLPQRAIQAALTIRQLMAGVRLGEAHFADSRDPSPEVRLVVHLGAICVNILARDPMDQLLAVGDTLALPMRLLGHTAPDEIVLSPRVGPLVKGEVELQARVVPLRGERPNQLITYTVVRLKLQHLLC
jgi:DNA-binding NtrC family response regulator